MAEDSTNPFASIIGALANKGGARDSAPEGVIKDSAQGVSPILTPAETARYEKIFGVMKRIVDPGPEAGKLDKTSTGKVGGVAAMQAAAKGKAEESGIDLGPLALAGVAAGIIGAALTQMEEDFINKIKGWGEGIVEFADSTGDEFGKLGAVAMKIAKFIPLKSLKMLPLIGSLINFYYAWDHFGKGEYFDGTWELISGLINFFPGGQFVSPLMDGYKIYAEILANKEAKETGKKPTFQDIIGRQLKAIGNWIMTKIQEGKVPMLSTFYMIGEGVGMLFAGDTKGGIEKLLMSFPAMLGQGYEGSPLMRGAEWFYELLFEEDSDARSTATKMAGNAWGWLEEAFSGIGEVIYSFWETVSEWVEDAIANAKNWAIDKINLIPGVDIEKEDPAAERKRMKAQREEMTARATDRKKYIDAHRERIGEDAYQKGKADMKASGRASIEYIDQIIALEKKYEAAGGKAAYDKQQQAQSDWVKGQMEGKTNAQMGYQNAIEDGIVHQNGRATRIDSGDSGIFAKKGGPIDKMLDQNSEVMKTIQGINKQQLSVLIEIRDGILELQKPAEELSFSSPSLTQDFFS